MQKETDLLWVAMRVQHHQALHVLLSDAGLKALALQANLRPSLSARECAVTHGLLSRRE